MRRELPLELLTAFGHRVLGVSFVALRALGAGSWYQLEPTHEKMPKVLNPPLTTCQVRHHATTTLPGAHV